jgi:hypothetical protein
VGFLLNIKNDIIVIFYLSHKENQMSTASDKAHEAAIAALLPEYELNKSTGEVQVVVTQEKKDSDHKRWIEAFGDCI